MKEALRRLLFGTAGYSEREHDVAKKRTAALWWQVTGIELVHFEVL